MSGQSVGLNLQLAPEPAGRPDGPQRQQHECFGVQRLTALDRRCRRILRGGFRCCGNRERGDGDRTGEDDSDHRSKRICERGFRETTISSKFEGGPKPPPGLRYLIATITKSTGLPLVLADWCATPRPMNCASPRFQLVFAGLPSIESDICASLSAMTT